MEARLQMQCRGPETRDYLCIGILVRFMYSLVAVIKLGSVPLISPDLNLSPIKNSEEDFKSFGQFRI